MTVPDYLRRPEAIRREILREQKRIGVLRGLSARLTARMQQVSVRSSPDPTRLQSLMAEIVDGENEILRLQEDLKQALADTAVYISLLPEEHLIRVLEARYLDGFGWEESASRLGYSLTSVFRYHRQALLLLPPPPEVPEESL